MADTFHLTGQLADHGDNVLPNAEVMIVPKPGVTVDPGPGGKIHVDAFKVTTDADGHLTDGADPDTNGVELVTFPGLQYVVYAQASGLPPRVFDAPAAGTTKDLREIPFDLPAPDRSVVDEFGAALSDMLTRMTGLGENLEDETDARGQGDVALGGRIDNLNAGDVGALPDSYAPPAASTTQAGVAQRAPLSKVATGTDDVAFVTPAGVRQERVALKAELLGGAGPAWDSLQELKALLDAAQAGDASAIDTLTGLIAGKEPALPAAPASPTGKYLRGDRTWQPLATDPGLSAAFVAALPPLAAVTAATALTKGKTQPVDATAGAIAMTALPALSGLTVGDSYGLQKNDSTSNGVSVAFQSGDTTQAGATSASLALPGSITLQVVAAPTGGGKFWRVVNHVRSDATLAGAYAANADTLALSRLERQAASAVRALGLRNAARAADATVVTENWASLAAWVMLGTSATVSGNRLFGSSGSAYGVHKGISVAAGVHFWAKATFHSTGASAKGAFMGINNDAAGGAMSAGVPNSFALGLNSSSQVQVFKGANITGSNDTPGSAALPAGDYYTTLVADETHLSLAITSATTGAVLGSTRILRTQLPGGTGALNNLMFTGTEASSTGVTWGRLDYVIGAMAPPASLAAPSMGVAKPTFINRQDTTTGIRHLVQVPGSYDPRVPAPVVLFLHGSTESAWTAFSTTKHLSITTALEAAGYIVVGSDNGTSISGSAATDATDNKYGSSAGCDDHEAAVKYVRDHFNTGAVFLWGVSMGTEFLQNILARRSLGGIAAAVSISPALDLLSLEQNATYQAGLWAAYGATDHATWLTAIAGKSPLDLQGYALRGVPQKFYAASDDTVAPPATSFEPLRARLLTYAAEAPESIGTGGHVAAALFQPSDVVTFFDKYRYAA